MPRSATEERLLREARRMVNMEKLSDFLNDYRQFFHRSRVGYYSDRLVLVNRWLLNDEQEQIDAYYASRKRNQ